MSIFFYLSCLFLLYHVTFLSMQHLSSIYDISRNGHNFLYLVIYISMETREREMEGKKSMDDVMLMS